MTAAVPLGTWHVYFDGEPELIGHICELHRALAQALGCDDQGDDGDCSHVQTRRCDCETTPPCGGCRDE
jgi:hypothetical protein